MLDCRSILFIAIPPCNDSSCKLHSDSEREDSYLWTEDSAVTPESQGQYPLHLSPCDGFLRMSMCGGRNVAPRKVDNPAGSGYISA